MFMRCRAVMTNTVPTAPFRGAGRPEATLVLERLIDLAAERLGIDRVTIRRQQRDRTRQAALSHRERAPLRQRRLRRQHEARGRQRRLEGLCGAPSRIQESAASCAASASPTTSRPRSASRTSASRSRCCPKARSSLRSARSPPDRATRPRFAQVMADLLGVHPEDIRFIGGDTAKVASGSGTHSDRSMRLGGTLMVQASNDVVSQAKAVAAAVLDVPAAEIDFSDGLFSAKNSNRRLTIYDVAQAIDAEPIAGRRPQAARQGDLHRPHSGLPDRLRDLRGRDRPRHRRDRNSALWLDRRRRPGDQSADPARPGAWRHRPGRRSGAARGRGLCRRHRPGAERQLHGLRHAARPPPARRSISP